MVSSRCVSFQDGVMCVEHRTTEMAEKEISYPSKLASCVIEADGGEANDIIYS